MRKINFFLHQMAFCKTYIPLIIEANKRNIVSDVYVEPSGKYNCPFRNESNSNQLINLSKIFNFNIKSLRQDGKEAKGLMFASERYLVQDPKNKRWDGEKAWKEEEVVWKYPNYLNMDNLKVVVLSNCLDFENTNFGHVRYSQLVNNIVVHSESYAKTYNTISDKNLYFGNPKYDYILSKKEVYEKYNQFLSADLKFCLLILPKMRDVQKCWGHLEKSVSAIREMGYKVIGKSREKDSYSNFQNLNNLCDVYLEDVTWFTHPTMDLINISDFVINCDSTTIEECVYLKTPVINFKIKKGDYFRLLYRDEYSPELSIENPFDKNIFTSLVKRITSENLEEYFEETIKQHLFPGNSSKSILDFFDKEI